MSEKSEKKKTQIWGFLGVSWRKVRFLKSKFPAAVLRALLRQRVDKTADLHVAGNRPHPLSMSRIQPPKRDTVENEILRIKNDHGVERWPQGLFVGKAATQIHTTARSS